jgi:hypothetical protein
VMLGGRVRFSLSTIDEGMGDRGIGMVC